MKKTTSFIISMILGIMPAWLLGFKAATLLETLTMSTKMIGNRRMLFYLHPALKLLIAAMIMFFLLFVWYKISQPIIEKISKLKLKEHLEHLKSSNIESLFTQFFSFGNWNSELIVKIIFYFGVLGVVLPMINTLKMMFFTTQMHSFNQTPFDSPFIGFILVCTSLIGLILWKCACEILLILLRSFEAYFFKTVQPERLDELKVSTKI